MSQLVAGAVWGGRLASLDPLALIWQASWVVQLVILLLAGFSILSWAVIVFKWRERRAAEDDDEAFLDVYHEGAYEEAFKAAHECDQGPLPAIFLAAHAERLRIAKYSGRRADTALDEAPVHGRAREHGARGGAGRARGAAHPLARLRGDAPAREPARLPGHHRELDALHRA